MYTILTQKTHTNNIQTDHTTHTHTHTYLRADAGWGEEPDSLGEYKITNLRRTISQSLIYTKQQTLEFKICNLSGDMLELSHCLITITDKYNK